MNSQFVQMIVTIGILPKELIFKHIQIAEKQNIQDIIQYFIANKVLSLEEVDFVYESVSLNIKASSRLGHFFVQRKIGEGGMGVIYKAYDLKARRVVALKIVKGSMKSTLRFQREMQLLAQIHHPNIVIFYGVHEINEMLLYSMEYVKGKTLSERQNLSLYKVAKIMSQVTSAIHFIHRLGIIHRDIKPSNIMITEDYIAKVMDFGLAKEQSVSSNITKSGVFIGTINYASPEQVRGEKLDLHTDIYSLGATLYKLLTKKVPFEGNSIHGIARKITEQPLLNPQKIKKDLPLPLAMICLKALQKEKQDRYQSSAAMSDDLQRFLKKRMVKAGENYFGYVLLHHLKKTAKTFLMITMIVGIFIVTFWTTNKWQEYALQNEAQHKYKMYQNIIAEKIVDIISTDELEVSASLAHKIDYAISEYLKARSLLQELRRYPDLKINTKEELYKVEKQIGLLALTGNHFMLSKVSFYRCQSLGYGSEVAVYLQKLQEKQQKLAEYPFNRLLEIIELLQNKKEILTEEFNDYTTEIARISNNKIQTKIVDLLQEKQVILRKFAVDVIGKMENPNIVVGDKDYGEWMLSLLNKEKDTQVFIRIIWALGRLKDTRAWIQIRDKANKKEFASYIHEIFLPISWLAKLIKIDTSKWEDPQQLLEYANLFASYRKEYEEAIKVCEIYLTLDVHQEKKLRVQESIGFLYLTLGEYQKSLEHLKKLISVHQEIIDNKSTKEEKYPFEMGLARINNNIASAYSSLYKIDPNPEYLEKAILGFENYIKLEPGWPGPNRGLAEIYALQEKYDEAIQQINLAVKKSKNGTFEMHQSYLAKSIIQLQFKHYDESLEDINKALEIAPNVPNLYFQRATIYYENKNFEQAYNDCSYALTLNPGNKEAQEFLEKLDFEIQKKEEKNE